MPHPNHEIAVRWFEQVWNQGRNEAIDELALPDAQSFGFPQPDSVLNREEFKAYIQEFGLTFSDIRIAIDETVSEDDRVAVRWTGTMKHTGAGLGIVPTGRTVRTVGMSLFHLQDGKIAMAWNALDLGTAIARLSAISARP